MAIQIKKTFELHAPIEQVWAFITDPYQVVACLPGAAITEKVDEQTYKGTITVKVGPMTINYKGKMTWEKLDREHYEAELLGRAQDVKGKGSADVRMETQLRTSENGQTEVSMTSDVSLIGPLAQFGGRLLQDVADQMIQQTTEVMQKKLAASAAPGTNIQEAAAQEPVPEPIKAVPFALKVLWRSITGIFRRA